MLCSHEKCTGCGACVNVCPVNCITMVLDSNGFLTPTVDANSCVHCGKCDSVCPQLHPAIPPRAIPEVFASRCNDVSILDESASGGMFTVLAQKIISKGGTVFGAAWDEALNCKHICVNFAEDLSRLRGSKYVQSDSGLTYREVSKLLRSDRDVLYVGVPCQVAGLYGYLHGDHERLTTIDLVCHGGGSVGVFRKYLTFKQHGRNLVSIDQTNKVNGWSPLIQKTIKFEYSDGSVEYVDSSQDAYLGPFLEGTFYRESCYDCPYATVPRVADITLADYFGLGCVNSCKLDTSHGVSQVLINSEKGLHLFNECESDIQSEERSLEECMMFNGCLFEPSHRSALRDEFLATYRSGESFEDLRQYLDRNESYVKRKRVRKLIKRVLGHRLTALGMYCASVLKGKRRSVRSKIEKVKGTYPLLKDLEHRNE